MRSLDKDYNNTTDEDLLIRLGAGEDRIIDYIMNKYKNLVRSKAKSMFLLGADHEDLIQEGMIGLFKAINNYDNQRDASFYTFAELCITRQLYTAIKGSRRQKHDPLNTSISIDENVSRDGNLQGEREKSSLQDYLTSVEQNPEELVIDKENVAGLEDTIERALSGFEKQVLEYYMTGMTYVQIAKELGKDEKATDNALQRVKNKIRRAICHKVN